jgi:hypothetical protein
MRLTFDNEHIVKCADCGEDAVERHVWVDHAGIRRKIVYCTHEDDLGAKEQFEVFKRIETFHKRAFELQAEVATLLPNISLSFGQIKQIMLGTVKPTACKVRTDIKPVITIRAFGFEDEIELDIRPLKGQSAKRILSEAQKAVEPVVMRFKQQRESGNY